MLEGGYVYSFTWTAHIEGIALHSTQIGWWKFPGAGITLQTYKKKKLPSAYITHNAF